MAQPVHNRARVHVLTTYRLCSLALGAVLFIGCGEDDRPRPSGGGGNGKPDASVSGGDAGTELDAGAPDAEPARGLALLGHDTHSTDNVELTEIGADGLYIPRDLDFNRDNPTELWVVNRDDDSTITYFNPGMPDQRAEKRIDPFAMHFMEEVSSIAFGAPGTFGTCQESRNTYNGLAAPNDFMGPSLWPSDMSIYAHTNEEAAQAQGADLGSHLDMLHESPLCMGIAWERDNIYWTFDGLTNSISRYDFQVDHGPGWDDHSDGLIERFVIGEVARVAGVPSHLELDRDAQRLYIADTGNARIAVLDVAQYTRGPTLPVKERGTQMWRMTGPSLTTFVDGAAGELQQPSGLALHEGVLYVGDFATGRITAFDAASGERLDWIESGAGTQALMGLAIDGEGRLYFLDAGAGRLMRIAPKP